MSSFSKVDIFTHHFSITIKFAKIFFLIKKKKAAFSWGAHLFLPLHEIQVEADEVVQGLVVADGAVRVSVRHVAKQYYGIVNINY